jgi:hypothetical protein
MTEESSRGADERPADAIGDAPTSWESNGTGETAEAALDDTSAAVLGETSDAPSGVTAPDQLAAPDDGTAFLANLASAMKEAATAERTRVAEDVDRRRETHLAGVETRRESEAGRMRQLADDDRASIQAWVESEQKRINEERDRRTAAVDSDLEASLAEHGAMIDAEKAQVEAAITAHRTELDTYFSTLEGETDPVAIAQQAGRRPAFPDLDAIGKDASAATAPPAAAAPAAAPAAQDRMIGVMASSRPTTKLSQAWAAWNASNPAEAGSPDTPAAEVQAATDVAATPDVAAAPETAAEAPAAIDPHVNPVDPGPVPEPVGVVAGGQSTESASAEESPQGNQSQSGSSFGGMSWLRRDKGNDQSK